MKKVIDYDIVEHGTGYDIQVFIQKVKDKIKDGWKPQGNIIIDDFTYYQVMVKEK
jgi:hypothetical protein